MKKKIVKFIAVMVIAVFAIGNVTENVGSSSNDISLNSLAAINVAQAEDDTWGNYYINWWTPSDVECYIGGYFCCPGWGDCAV